VKLQRFAAEARVLNVARMKELTEEKRFALAAALLFRQLAHAYDDAADMLIRQVQRIHHKAKEPMDLRQASHLQHSAASGVSALPRTNNQSGLPPSQRNTAARRAASSGRSSFGQVEHQWIAEPG
jgi:hypothetical protein